MSDRRRALLVFATVFVLLLALHGNRLLLNTNDEGICLEAAQRMLSGQKLYVDFFAIVSPGVYWVQAFSLWIFGATMYAGRIPIFIYCAMDCALLYWLAARLSCKRAALTAVIFFLVFLTADPSVLTPQHRWDSSAISLLGIALAVHSQRAMSRLWITVSGALFVLATVFTPPMALVGVATGLCLMVQRITRPLIKPMLVGCVAMAAILLGAIWGMGILPGLVGQMLWLSRNYSGVNVMHYGAIIGGYGSLLAGTLSFDWTIRLLIVICLALPAILPIASLLGWSCVFWFNPKAIAVGNNRTIIYLLICMAVLVVTTHPRSDVAHLAYIAPIPYALTTALVFSYLSRPVAATLIIVAAFVGTLLCLNNASILLAEQRTNTPIGTLRANASAAVDVAHLLARVRPREILFVHPYKPLLYFLTQARNPTRYSFLAPGVMKDEDERIALAALHQQPPEWVLHLDVSSEDFLRVFPSGDPSTIQFKSIEHWIHERYTPVNPPVIVSGYQLYQANADPSASQSNPENKVNTPRRSPASLRLLK